MRKLLEISIVGQNNSGSVFRRFMNRISHSLI